jgi:hypothetical protein
MCSPSEGQTPIILFWARLVSTDFGQQIQGLIPDRTGGWRKRGGQSKPHPRDLVWIKVGTVALYYNIYSKYSKYMI